MENKKLTPGEIAVMTIKPTSEGVSRLVKYAAEKEEEVRSLKKEMAEKDALLKEARRIFYDYLTGKSSLRLFKADARIFIHKLNHPQGGGE